MFITGIAGPGTDFRGAVGEVRTVCIVRTGGNDSGPFTAHIGISAFAFGRAVVVIFHTAIPQSNVGVVAADVAVIGVSRLADRRTGRRIIFGAAVLPFVNPGRTDTVGILSAAAVPGYRTRIRTVGRVVKIHILADTAFVSAAAFGTGTVFFGRTGNQRGVALTGSVLSVAAFTDADLSGGTAYQIGNAFAAKSVGRVIRTNAVNRLHGIAVLSDKAFVQTLAGGVDGVIVIAAT